MINKHVERANRVITVLFYLGSTLLFILLILSGSINHFPINKFYWLSANTSNIPGAPYDISRWTFWGLCAEKNDKNVCSNYLSPAYPISPKDNFDTTTNLPPSFVSNRSTYFYLTRFDFVFFWLGLIFTGVNTILYIFTFCSYSFTKVVWFLQILASVFTISAVCMQTAAVAMAKNAFKNYGDDVSIGPALMGISWAILFLTICLFFMTGGTFIKKGYKHHQNYVEMSKYKEDALKYQQYMNSTKPINTDNASNPTDPYSLPSTYDEGYQQQNAEKQQQQQPVDIIQKSAGVIQQNPKSSVKFFHFKKTKKIPHNDDGSV
ncbi:Sur7p SCDLUD_000433 [Saccharomycodes ludwigii]|uniref:Sur7p n=1 Tax=Saccharomycodes ludwigii TaxID=36035 RepID=UPI001E8AADB5|nr:hypothetical protein SCDLUD_000433 [Saccharomycodes ludwigii]KAH3902841.1 hypothetical protein SCDLUD_000433 [Saccharomycodes ludwigii]